MSRFCNPCARSIDTEAVKVSAKVTSWLGRPEYLVLLLVVTAATAWGAETSPIARFRAEVLPILNTYCSDCHADGMDKGGVAFDAFKSDEALVADHKLWSAVLKNTRAGVMPPEKKPRPSAEEQKRLEEWIKFEALAIDPANPDPGRVTLRRLNRVEYRNTIRDLMGFDFKVDEELPPDDTGYGFDNIGDVLSMSPLLLEKYMQAAERIVAAAVPRVARVVQKKEISGNAFRKEDGTHNERYSFYDETKLSHEFHADQRGSYGVELEVEVAGQFDFDPGRCRVVFKVDDTELLDEELGWLNGKKRRFELETQWQPGVHCLSLELYPLTPVAQKKNSLDLRIGVVRVMGPLEEQHWVRPENFDRFFSADVPESLSGRREYTRDVLARFAKKAFRRPVDKGIVERLVAIAEETWNEPGKVFQDGIAQAMIPILASPRFLFRVEASEAGRNGMPYPLVDSYSLASRLSYFLWSTMPDDELVQLADRGELRKNLAAQVKRMLADKRSDAFVESFVGQWLQIRDVEGIDINAQAVLARDSGQEKEVQDARRRSRELRAIPEQDLTPEQKAELERLSEQRRRRSNRPTIELDGPLRRALRQEAEMVFAYILREDRSLLEFIDSNYTFLNERLAKHYGIPDVAGNEMRRVALAADSPRGGVLTQGGVLVVTSNPTRTSPVKRGLFILDNLIGMPPPPPPADIPDLEQSEKQFKDREPTLREALEVHRAKPLCNSCHSRMDPLGLALENFNALGMWRDKERGQAIETAGKLITGESFKAIRDMKRVLATERRPDFYRCLTEKLLIYALGRGLEYYDVHAVDEIVNRLDREGGRFSALLMGIVESAPFQHRRDSSTRGNPDPSRSREESAITEPKATFAESKTSLETP